MRLESMKNEGAIIFLLRLSVSSAFLYPPIAAIMDPLAWIGFFPDFLRELAGNDTLLLHTFGLAEVVVGLWILSGKRIFIPSLVASAILLGIIVFNWASLDIIFRDIAILGAALALAVWSRPQPLRFEAVETQS